MWLKGLKSASSVLEDFYTLGKVIGKGSYGEVFLGTDKVSKETCAVKIIRKNPSNRKQKKFIERERAIMTRVDHPNIVKTFDVFEGPSKLAIVSEYMAGGELFDLIIASQYFTEDVRAHRRAAGLRTSCLVPTVQLLTTPSPLTPDRKPA
jgi:serine/threonine protein kinase